MVFIPQNFITPRIEDAIQILYKPAKPKGWTRVLILGLLTSHL